MTKCKECSGNGKLAIERKWGLDFVKCSACKGTGKVKEVKKAEND